MRTTTSFLSRFVASGPAPEPGWWEYFGAFGNDFFGDDDLDDTEPELMTPDR